MPRVSTAAGRVPEVHLSASVILLYAWGAACLGLDSARHQTLLTTLAPLLNGLIEYHEAIRSR